MPRFQRCKRTSRRRSRSTWTRRSCSHPTWWLTRSSTACPTTMSCWCTDVRTRSSVRCARRPWTPASDLAWCSSFETPFEGRKMLKALTKAGIPVTYVDLTAMSYVMGLVDKVLLGAGALLSNGAVISRAGTALVAMTAKRHNAPATVCCETYKFSHKVQLDFICWNEVGDPEELVTLPRRSDPPLSGWKTVQPLKLLNLRSDLTPRKYVSLVITELGTNRPPPSPWSSER